MQKTFVILEHVTLDKICYINIVNILHYYYKFIGSTHMNIFVLIKGVAILLHVLINLMKSSHILMVSKNCLLFPFF